VDDDANSDIVILIESGKPNDLPNPMPKSTPGLLSSPSADKLQGFISSLPGMACQIELQGGGSITFSYAIAPSMNPHRFSR